MQCFRKNVAKHYYNHNSMAITIDNTLSEGSNKDMNAYEMLLLKVKKCDLLNCKWCDR